MFDFVNAKMDPLTPLFIHKCTMIQCLDCQSAAERKVFKEMIPSVVLLTLVYRLH